nr:LOW QUALITY PROTEIN: uncharacterized protein LOC129271848 [Lytechinus pictus]
MKTCSYDEAPILNCPNITSTTDTGFNFSSSVILNSTATDNVDTEVSADCIPSSEYDFVVGDTIVNCTSTDTAGNTGSCILIVTVIDDEAPILNCPNITSTTDTGFNFSSSVILNSTATDNVDTEVSAYCIPSSEDDFVVGDTTVNCTSTDTAGNTGSCGLIVTVLDDEAPILNCPNITSTTDSGFNFSSSVILNSTATDNVDTEVSAYCIPSSENDFVVGDTTVNCTSTDTAGNTRSCSLIVTVLDDEAPILNCPNITSTTDTGFNFSSSVILNSTATDNVDTEVSADCIPSSEDDFVVGDTIVNCTSTDTAGNTGSCILIVTVIDDEGPILNCPNITSTTDTGFNFSSSVMLNSTANDNVDTEVSAYCIPSSEDDFVVGDTIVNCTSTDTAGNTGSCILIVTVLDDEAPILNCPNITSTTDTGFNFSSSVILNSTATDNVDTEVSADCIPSSEYDFVVGDTTVNCTSTDTAGNTGSCILIVTVLDDEAPILNCPNITSTTDTGFNFSSSVILNSTATDNVDTEVSADCIPSSEYDFVVGDTIVNCTSTDTAGNTGSCILIVTVIDDEAPILNCPNITSTTDTGFNFSSSVILNSTATDNVDTEVSAYCIPSSEDDFVVGDTTVNCTSTDTAGNTGSCGLIVTVLDDEAPILNCPNITSTTDTGFNFSSSVILNSTATDNVDTEVSADCIPSSEDDFVVGDTIVNCTSTDTAGNTGSCILIVTVIDDEAPILNCPNITSTTDTGFNFSSSVILNSTATDNVDTEVSAYCIPSSEDDFVVGDTIVNCTSTDTAGNTGSCSLIVTVLDDEAPILNCPNITTTDTGFNFSSSVILNSTATDNVDTEVSADCIPSSEYDFVVADTIVNCTSTDTAGNTGSCILIVTVIDDEAPILNCPNITSTTDTGFNFSSSVILNSTATDNVDIDVSLDCIPSSEDDFIVGDTTVNCTSTDTAGNTGSCSFVLTVIDDEAPVLNCPNITSTTDTGFSLSSTVMLNSTATDNVDANVSVDCIPSSFNNFLVGDTTVNCTSTDTAGNTGSCSLVVTVIDDEAPVFNCPNISAISDVGFNFSSFVMLNSSATDNVDTDVSAYCIPSSEDDFVVGDTIVNCTSTDTAGNTGSCSLIVTVIDYLFCPENISTIVDPFSETATVVLLSIGVGVVTSPQNGSVFMQGSTPVLVTREEEQCIFYVYVEPLLEPTCEDIFQLSPLSTVVVIWFIEEPTQYSLETVVGGEMASYIPTLNIAFIEVSVPSVLEGVVSITDHPDYNCSFTLSVFPYTCNVTSYPSEYLTSLSATNQEFDISPEEQCFGESMITVNTTCIFGCDVGYNLIGNESVSCLEDGLSDSLPTCELVTCQLPTIFPSFLHTTSTINNCTEGEQVVYNSSCSYDCEVGYNLTGNSTVSCLENGEFSSELPKCGIVQCFVPSFSERLISLESTCYERMYINFTDICYFGCDVGFDLIGNDTVTCGEDALLSSELPTCQVVSCSIPVLPPRLSTMTTQCHGGLSISYTDTCSYSCDEGYNLIGSESVTCLANTSLSDFLPTCEVVSCSIPVLPPRLSTMTSQCDGGQSINYTDICSYSCDVGYNLIGSESVTCLANTSLSDFLPTCEVVTCSVPQLLPPLLTSCLIGQEVNYNTSCEFACSPGFDIIGSTSLDCLANGTLSGDIPMCEIVVCPLPEVFHPELSSIFRNCSEGSSIDFDTTCVFECSEGYDLIGSESVKCQSNGTLSESLPTCNVISCTIPVLPSHLSTLMSQCNGGQSINYTDTCLYSCDVGYNLLGSESVTCLANTSLSDFLPTCEVVVCLLPEVFHPELSSVFNGNCSRGSSIDFNTTCNFECSEGYDLIGSESVGCLSNGTLSESLPTCNVMMTKKSGINKKPQNYHNCVCYNVCSCNQLIDSFYQLLNVPIRMRMLTSRQHFTGLGPSHCTESMGSSLKLPHDSEESASTSSLSPIRPENISTIVDPFSEMATVVLPSTRGWRGDISANGSVFYARFHTSTSSPEKRSNMFPYNAISSDSPTALIEPTCEDISALANFDSRRDLSVEELHQYSLETVVETRWPHESAILINNETFYFSVYPWDYDYQRLYRDWLFETNTGNGFRVDLYTYVECFDYYCGHDGVFTIIIGTGKDSTNQESGVQTFTTKTTYRLYYRRYEELYVDSQEIWIVLIGPQFVGYGDYDELNLYINAVNMSGWIPCKDSRASVPSDYACNGRYECDDYGDETTCDRSPTIISDGESYAISDLELFEREYHAFILQTNQYSRFHIRFQHISLGCCDERVQIGTGTDLSDEESVIMSIQGYTNYVDDVYVNTTHMWLVMTGQKDSDNYPNGHVDMIVTAISLSAECLSNPCLNGGTCNHLADGGYRCDCMDTFTGLNCEIAL